MARKKVTKMAYSSGDEMMFGTAKHPVTTKRGIVIGRDIAYLLHILTYVERGIFKGLNEFDLWDVKLFGGLNQNISSKTLVT